MTSPALDLAARIVARPPARLSELEALVGSLNVDFAGREGMGHFSRPTLEETIANKSSLPPGLVDLSVDTAFDIHHDDPKRPRDLVFRSVTYRVDATPSDVARVVESAYGTPTILDHAGMCFETVAGTRGLIYLPIADAPTACIEWHASRPPWAHAPVPDDVRRTLLVHLIAALMVADTPEQVAQRVRSRLAAGGAVIDTTRDTVWLKLAPALPLAVVVQALGWVDVLAYSGDVHMQTWTVIPAELVTRPSHVPTIASWCVDVRLTEWPLDARERGTFGASPLYELGSNPYEVDSIAFRRGE